MNPAIGVLARYVVLGAVLAVPVALAWVVLAPRVLVRSVADASFVEAYPQGFAAADLILASLLGVAGVVIGILAARRLRATGFSGGWVHVVGTILAAVICGAVARVLGWWLAGRSTSPRGELTALPLTVTAQGVLLVGVLSGLLVVLLLSAFARDGGTQPGVAPEAAEADSGT